MVCLYSTISPQRLSVHNNNESFSKTITDGKVAKLKVMFDSNHAEPKNAQNKLAVVRTRGNLPFIISNRF